jgi:hypothetical protein
MPVVDYPVRHLPDAEVQALAVNWRKQLERHFLSNCLDVAALFSAVGQAVNWPIKVEARPDSAMGQANAFVSADRSTVYVREGLIRAATNGDPEAVFDVTHEVGHIVLHRAQVPLARMATRDNHYKFLQPEESAEHQANVFTRTFLMTDEEVALYPTAEALSENCFTPLHQAVLRLAEYGRTTGRMLRKATRNVANTRGRDEMLQARLKGYEHMRCGDCRNFTLVRSGSCLTCDTCGGTNGCS